MQARFDALQARASASEKLLGDAREHLLARADEIRIYDRRAGELAMEGDALQARITDLETERMQRESQFTEVDQARATLMERSTTLVFSRKPGAAGRKSFAAYVAFVIVRGQPVRRVDLGRAEPLDDMIAHWRQAILGGKVSPAASL